MNTARVIASILLNHTGTTDLVSNRIYPIVSPQQQTFPYITFQLISLVPIAPPCSGYDRARYQIDIYAITQSEASDIKDQVRAALDGATTPDTYDGVKVSSIRFDLLLEDDYSLTDRVHNIRLEYLIDLNS